jgi:hypothetical protein
MNISTGARVVPRRHALRLSAMLAALLILIAGPSAAAATDTSGQDALVGSWNVTISIFVQDPPLQEHATFTFSADHRFTTSNTTLPGEGIWQTNGRHLFTFWISHPHPDATNPIGTTNALHLGRVIGQQFATTATAYIVMLQDGAWIGPITVRTEGTRIAG